MLKFIILFFTLIFTSGIALGQQKIDSKIERVTVFLNGGQVIRTASTTLPTGKSEVILKGLTPNLDAESLIVKGEGDFTIMSVKHQMNFFEEIKRKDTIIVLEAQRDTLLIRLIRQGSEAIIMAHEEELLQRNRVQMLGVQNAPAKTEDVKIFMDFQHHKLNEIYTKLIDFQLDSLKTRQKITKINNQLSELNARKNTATAEVVVTVFVKNTSPQNCKLQLEYIIPNANWSPLYDLRVKDVNSPVVAQMKAKVRQNSGEDWKNVQLTLSTGEPKRSGIKPELGTWMLNAGGNSLYFGRKIDQLDDFNKEKQAANSNIIQGTLTDTHGEPLIGASVVIKGTNIGTQTDLDGHYSLKTNNKNVILSFSYIGFKTQETNIGNNSYVNMTLDEDNARLEEVVISGYASGRKKAASAVQKLKSEELQGKMAGVQVGSYNMKVRGNASISPENNRLDVKQDEKTTTTAFNIDLPYTIPTDGKEYQVEIKEVSMAAAYQYACAPKLDEDAFLTAFITDWEQYSLIEGEANLYFEGTYLGKTLLKTNSVDDTLKISLGRDKNVVVKRTKLKEFSKNATFSSKRTDSRNYEITVKNKKSYPLSINIEEQIPVSTDKAIEVDFEAVGAEYDKNTGHLTWKVALNANEDKKLQFKYTVKHPSSIRIPLE